MRAFPAFIIPGWQRSLHPFQEFLLSVTTDDVILGFSNLHQPVITTQTTTVHAVNATSL